MASAPATVLVTAPARARAPRTRSIVLVMAVAVLAAACADTTSAEDRFGGRVVRRTPGTEAPPPPTPTTTAPPYAVKYQPTTCWFPPESTNGFKVDCGTLTVPAKRSPVSSSTIKIAVARIHSSSPAPQPDPVVYLAGGPGGSAISDIDFWTKPAAPLLENRDLILVDQRGTGYSEPRLTCEQFDVDLNYIADVGSLALDCLRKLQNTGIDLSAFTTNESAADISDLRWAMKFDQWNLFGISYGTRLALWIMKTHPQGVRTVVLDSAYPPGVKKFNEIPTNLNRAVQAVLDDCAAQPACAATYPDLAGQLARGIDRANAEGGFSGDDFVDLLFQSLYHSEVIQDVPKAIKRLADGNTLESFQYLTGKGARERHPDEEGPPPSSGSRPRMSDALHSAVECAESAATSTSEGVRSTSSPIAKQLRDPLVRQMLQGLALCNVWKVPQFTLTEVTSSIPTLVLAGTYDPITPPAWGELAAKTLPNSKFVLVNGSGHAVWASGDCPQQLVKLYIDDPVGAGPDCSSAPPEFSR